MDLSSPNSYIACVPAQTSSTLPWIILLILLVIGILVVVWFFQKQTPPAYNFPEFQYGDRQHHSQGIEHRNIPQRIEHRNIPQDQQRIETKNLQKAPNLQKLTPTPSNPQSIPATQTSKVSGTTINPDTYDLSKESKEYLKEFQPASLNNTMPSGWRSQEPAQDSTGVFNEFSRYAISPNMMKRSESMRSVIRLGENSRDGMGRTLGYQSLLRDAVTPTGPQPIGSSAIPFNDSSVRQNYIAASTGQYPTQVC